MDILGTTVAEQRANPSPSDFLVIEKINNCPHVPCLRSVNKALINLLNSEHSFMAQIAEVISRDPALSSRLLNLVNSIFYSLTHTHPITSIEEAAFYVGLRQLQELVNSTPVIEELMEEFKDLDKVEWKEFWRHSIGTAILTREVLSVAEVNWENDSDYIAGLVHNIGKIIIAFSFPKEFSKLATKSAGTTEEVCSLEQREITWDHARIGGYYLWRSHIAQEIVEAVQYHNNPNKAPQFPELAAAVQIADHITRAAGIQGIEKTNEVIKDDWLCVEGWRLLFGEFKDESLQQKIQSLDLAKDRIASILKGIV